MDTRCELLRARPCDQHGWKQDSSVFASHPPVTTVQPQGSMVDRVTGSHAPQTRPELGKKTKERCKLGGGRFKMQGNLLTRLVLGGLRCLSFKVYPTHIP